MAKDEIAFETFLEDVAPDMREFVSALHGHMLANGCKASFELKSSGYLASYSHKNSKRIVANLVFRKNGLIVRVYADNLHKYASILQSFPAAMLKKIAKAPACKRLLDPDACNSRCPMGYEFELAGETQKKCRYNCFMLETSAENNPFIEEFIEKELSSRNASA